MTPTPDQLALWAKLAAEATPGPWAVRGSEGFDGPCDDVITKHESRYNCNVASGCDESTGDALFIAAARTAVPVLLAEVERLGKGLDEAWAKRRLYFHERNEAAHARVAALETALRRYGRHLPVREVPCEKYGVTVRAACPKYETDDRLRGDAACTCGLDTALKGATE